MATKGSNRSIYPNNEFSNEKAFLKKEILTEMPKFCDPSFYKKARLSESKYLHLQGIPENFRDLSLLPTVDDIHLPCSFLCPNIVKGKYENAEHYLDIQFRLLREDYIKPLRDGVAEYIKLKKNDNIVKKCEHVRVYCNTVICTEEFVDGDLLHTIQFQEKYFSTIKWESSNRFLTGNLLCLSVDDFRTTLLASVVERNTKELRKGLLLIKFEETVEKLLHLDLSLNYVVIELPTLFEAYRHNLKVLQELNENSLAMKNYIVNVEKTVKYPQYLHSTTVYDMRPLLLPLGTRLTEDNSIKTGTRYETVNVLDANKWPSATELNLDESQYNALKSAITKEFAIIQGPPGTGKTYIGLRIVQLLLHNLDVWYHGESDCMPLLVVSYTNHALDQFLEEISKITKKIVRIGGRSSNEKIGKFQIKNLILEAKSRKLLWTGFMRFEARKEIEYIKKEISCFERNCYFQTTNDVLHESILEGSIPSYQFYFLMETNYSNADSHTNSRGKIFEWLEIDTFNDCQLGIYQDKEESLTSENVTNDIECEFEEMADIEFIESQRDVKQYNFSDRIVLRTHSQFKRKDILKSQCKSNHNKKKLDDYIKNSLQNNPVMDKHRALNIKDVWKLPINERWQLYKFWLELFCENKFQNYLKLQQRLKDAFEELSDIRREEDLFVLKDAQVVGMTTTGAAKYRHIIEARNPVVVVVEEAAEILESHIVTSLTSKTKHVILIGDQQQLRPSPTVYELAVKYGMNISLFERMIMNGMEFCQLSLQHRMRPEIASLIVPHIYSNLKNHEIVTKFEDIKGVCKNMFFINHTFRELSVQDSKSKANEHEATFLINLCKYLIQQGYESSQITVLTTYSRQLFLLKKLAVDKDIRKVRFAVVDNFQGEENDIIIISFVRSNVKGNIGFLKISNRVCVALSRAKKGLYCIGNFTLLAQKSSLWDNIFNMLTSQGFIGPSLRLTCQNHPEVFTDVAKEFDFNSVPEGGCTRKCEYCLLCGHLCTLLCHPYDKKHEKFKCLKPCTKTCEKGHPCQKICFNDCKPCPILIEKVLSKCGHTVSAQCGKNECEIKCHKACKQSCEKGHPCPKKCFERCGLCKTVVEKVLPKCGHTVSAQCGKNESEINCHEACKKSCEKGHPCPKKCFEKCCLCKTVVEKVLPKCGHTVSAQCGKNESEIKCHEACKKSCEKGHPCPKKCFEPCGSCKVVVEKVLSKCSHKVSAFCAENESLIKCFQACKKNCKEGHPCTKKCFESCGFCEIVVTKILPDCKHTVKIACWKTKERIMCQSQCIKTCSENHLCQKKCFENCGPCETIVEKTLKCEHSMMVPCGQEESEIKCQLACKKILSCLHQCKNKCFDACEKRCLQLVEIQSHICGHSFKIECCFVKDTMELSKRCLKPCRKVLPCGHRCTGSCGSCYQGRLHSPCKEVCIKTLICGHKCEAKCFLSCPPCRKPCETRCVHGRCPNKCGDPCVMCSKPCSWSCSHKKCTRRCGDVCNRGPCDKKCLKKLPCSHSCVGFCGEPCPEICVRCEKNTVVETASPTLNLKTFGYIYLDDCKHTLKEIDLRNWLKISSNRLHEIKPQTCPKCGTVIRTNLRFNNIIKICMSDIERVKEVARYHKNNNLVVQRNLLKQINESHFNMNVFYNSVIKVLSGGRVRDIFELTNLRTIMSIANEIEGIWQNFDDTINLTPFIESSIVYMRSCREWMISFIRKNFLSASEYQLQQLSEEVYRLKLLCFLLNTAGQKHFSSLEIEECTSKLMNYMPLTFVDIKHFRMKIKNFDIKLSDIPVKNCYPQEVFNMSAEWYRCSKNHIICYPKTIKRYEKRNCYKCPMPSANENSSNVLLNSDINAKSNLEIYHSDVEQASKGKVPDDSIAKHARFSMKNGSDSNVRKTDVISSNSNISTKIMETFDRKMNADPVRKLHELSFSECSLRKHNSSRKTPMKNQYEKKSIPRDLKKETLNDNPLPKKCLKNPDEKFSNPCVFKKETLKDNAHRKNIVKNLPIPKPSKENKIKFNAQNSTQKSNHKNIPTPSACKKETFQHNSLARNSEKYYDKKISTSSACKKETFQNNSLGRISEKYHDKKNLTSSACKKETFQDNSRGRNSEKYHDRKILTPSVCKKETLIGNKLSSKTISAPVASNEKTKKDIPKDCSEK